jgi:hypothetical protein
LHGPNPPKFHLQSRERRTEDRRRTNETSEAQSFGGVGILVRMPGEGDVTALPLFRRGAEEARASELVVVVRVGQGRMWGGTEDSSLFSFWREQSVRFAIFSRADVEDSFLVSRCYTLSCGRT